MIDPSRRARLSPRMAPHFPGDTLFDRVARVLCAEGCVPRKELYESWEVARRTRRRFRGGRVVDLAAGHGLLAHLMLLLDDTSRTAIAVDTSLAPSARRVSDAITRAWPRLEGRVTLVSAPLETAALDSDDLVVSVHACGALTDRVLERAADARARVAVLPCCHDEETCDAGGLRGWLDLASAVDATRARRLASRGYGVFTQTIPEAITPKNRLLLGEPERSSSRGVPPPVLPR